MPTIPLYKEKLRYLSPGTTVKDVAERNKEMDREDNAAKAGDENDMGESDKAEHLWQHAFHMYGGNAERIPGQYGLLVHESEVVFKTTSQTVV